jgi:hypothetical protein
LKNQCRFFLQTGPAFGPSLLHQARITRSLNLYQVDIQQHLESTGRFGMDGAYVRCKAWSSVFMNAKPGHRWMR